MISRRGLFKMLGAVAASPALKPLAGLFPETYTCYMFPHGWVSYRVTYHVGPPPGRFQLRRIESPDNGQVMRR